MQKTTIPRPHNDKLKQVQTAAEHSLRKRGEPGERGRGGRRTYWLGNVRI